MTDWKIASRVREEDYINLNPLQTGGASTADARKAVISHADGYSICDWCAGELCSIEKPRIRGFLDEAAKFLGMDNAMITNGCREAKYAILHAITKPGEAVVLDDNRHYSSHVACERMGLRIYEAAATSEPDYEILPQAFQNAIETVKARTGNVPNAALLTHVDGSYGNVTDARAIAGICSDAGVPLILNAAYSAGRMPLDNRKIGADFIACSCHKSWSAAGGNIGLLATDDKWSEKIFKKSERYKSKPLEILGCSARGPQAVALMASFDHVKERVKNWDEEVKKARWLMDEFRQTGIEQVGQKPTHHDLNFVKSDILYEISKRHKKKNFFLYHELKKRGIIGVRPGLTKNFKLSTYGKSREQIRHVAESFKQIIGEFSG